MRKEIALMQILRVPPLGKLVVEVNDQRYQDVAEISDEQVKRLILAAIGELVNFAGGYGTLVDAGLAPAIETPQTPQTPVQGVEPDPSRRQKQAEFLATLEAERDAIKDAPPPPKPSLLNSLRPRSKEESIKTFLEDESPSPPKRELSIVEQIDLILQDLIATDPVLAQRSIHLEQDPSGGLRIAVDGKYYQKPAQIEEQKIQVYIKRALKAWESS